MNFPIILKYLPKIIDGIYLTLKLLFFSSILGLILAVLLGISLASKNKYIYIFPNIYNLFFRGTPLLLQLFLLYYGVAQFEFIRGSFLWNFLKSPYWCALTVMSLNTAAYTSEIIKGAITNTPKGEIEACQSLGFNKTQILKHIIIPRIIRTSIPAYSNEIIFMLKATSLASTITLLEITGSINTAISRTFMSLEFYCLAALIYLAITIFLLFIFKLIFFIFKIPET